MRAWRYGRHFCIGFLIVVMTACVAQSTEEPPMAEPDVEVESPTEEESQAQQDQSDIGRFPEDLQRLADEIENEGCTYNLYALGWVMDWADAGNIVDTVFGPDTEFQYTFWELAYPDLAEEFRDLAYQAYRETDQISRAELWGQAEDMIIEDIGFVLPLNYVDRVSLMNTDVNYYFPPFGAPRISRWSSKTGASTLVLPLGTDPTTLDPIECSDVFCGWILYQLLDSPYIFQEDGSIAPLAATGFEVNEDTTTYTVHLRRDAFWSDGESVLAQHFVDGILRLLHPDTTSDYAYVLNGIQGAPEYASGESDSLEGLTVLDEYTFQFTLHEPLSYFDSQLASTFLPIRLDLIESFPDTYTQPGFIVSNGAYVLSEYSLGSHIVLEKNPFYWNAENIAYDRIEIPIIPEEATCIAAFESGDIDTTSCGFPFEDTSRWENKPEFIRMPRPGTLYLGINMIAEHTIDRDLRLALAQAIDKRTYNDVALESPWKYEARGIIPPEIYGYQGEAVGFDFDAQKALDHLRKYMERAEISDPGEIVLELWYFMEFGEDGMEMVEAMWEGTLGIDIRLISMEWKTYISILETCKVMSQVSQ